MAPIAQLKEEEVRARIVRAAAKLFQQHGLVKVTLEDIASASDRSKSSLYYYYKGREEILDDVLKMEIFDAEQRFTREIAQTTTMLAKLEAFCLTKLAIYREKTALYAVVSRNARNSEHVQRVRQKYMRSEQRILLNILEYGRNELGKVISQDLTTASFLLISSLQGVSEEQQLYSTPAKAKHVVRLLCSIFVQGLMHLSPTT